MFINLKNNTLIVSFRYEPRIIQALRTICGRKFNPDTKNWEVPSDNVTECLDVLMPLGFTANKDVMDLYDSIKAKIKEAEALKTGHAAYDGTLPLYDFQKTGVLFLKGMGSALLADVPGLGKTIQTIAALEDNSEEILIFCPSSLKYGWQDEVTKWDPKASVQVIDGKKIDRIMQWKQPAHWKIANYELLLHDYDELKLHDWGAIVCDEATRISNSYAKSVKKLKTLRAKLRIALTGTPISNSPKDIYSIIDWICPGYLGSFYQFCDRYCLMNPRYPGQVLGYKNVKNLSDKIAHLVLRRTKEEVLTDFPPKTVKNVEFDLSGEEKKLYEAVRLLIIKELGDLKVNQSTLGLAPVKLLRLKQVTGYPGLLFNEKKCSKLETLKEVVNPILESGEKVIIFTQFAQVAKMLLGEFGMCCGAELICGEVTSLERKKIVDKFTNNFHTKVLIMTEAGAYGLNLQAASYVVHYDMPWSVAKLMQREDRAHRIGQTKPVTVYNLIARQTVDEYVAKVLHKKQKVSVEILKDAERLEEMGLAEDDIKNILRI